MVLYVDRVFALNCISDAFALYATACLSGQTYRWNRLILASLCGGLYGVICIIPILGSGVCSILIHIAVAVGLVKLVFRTSELFLRTLVLFYVLSWTMGGILFSFSERISNCGTEKALEQLNWKVFMLAGCITWFLVSIIFKNGAQHAIRNEIVRSVITLDGKTACINALYDTGHTLRDSLTGENVMTVWWGSVRDLLSKDEVRVFSSLEQKGAIWCISQLSVVSPGRYRLLPYNAVGVREGVLLALRSDSLTLNGRNLGRVVIALSPTPLSDGSGYSALWGGADIGERSGKSEGASFCS